MLGGTNRWWYSAMVLAGASLGLAQDWPQFRGPKRDGLSADTKLLAQWPVGGPRLVWQAKGVGGGYASVSVAKDKVFTLGNKGPLTHLFALDRESGKVLWSAEVGRSGGNLGCTPTVDGDRLYAIGQEGDLVCVEVASGAVRWRKNFFKDFGGKYGGWKFTESPLVDGDKLVCTPGGSDATMVALDKLTGNVIWKGVVPAGDAAGYSSIVIAQVGGIRQYVQLLADSLVGIDARTGQLLWRYGDTGRRFGNNTANIPTPIVRGDLVFCAAGYGRGAALLRLVPEAGGIQVEEIYFKRELTNKHGGVILVGDHLYGDRDDSGRPFCADFQTGDIVPGWQKIVTEGRGSMALTYADGHLYCRYDNGHMALVEATPAAYREKSSFKIPNAKNHSWAHPVVVGGRLYLREQDSVGCYDVRQ
jgi:outer membrane protein assembly factor BamB